MNTIEKYSWAWAIDLALWEYERTGKKQIVRRAPSGAWFMGWPS